MNLDTSFLASETSAAPESTAPVESAILTEAPVETPLEVISDPAQPVVDAGVAVEPVIEDPAVEVQDDQDANPFDDEEIKKSLEDEKAPKWYRDALKKAQGYTHKLKEKAGTYETELNDFRSKYEGREALAAEDLERMRAAEERQYKLASFTATPEEILSSISEVVPQQKLAELKSRLTWGFLEDPQTGQPDLENLQVIVDRFSGYNGEGTQVKAKDVLNAIGALKRGTISDAELHEFSSDAEYQAYQKAQEMERAAEQRDAIARSNAEFQEKATRTTLLQSTVGQIQSQFQPRVENLLSKFQLNPVEGEPKESAEFKQDLRDKIASTVNQLSSQNAHIQDIWKALELLGNPTGARAEAIQQEINQFTASFPFQTAVSRGLEDLMGAVEKVIAKEAYRYGLLMEGYKVRASKGQTAREVVGEPNQTEVVTNYTQEELSKMTAAERRQARMQQFNSMVAEAIKPSGGRYGG